MTVITNALDKMRSGLVAEAAAARIASAKADLLNLERNLTDALNKARAYTDPDLSNSGLQARREQLAKAAREAAGPALEQLRGQVTSAAETLATQAAAGLPKFGADPAAIARSQHKWDQVRMRLDAGMPMRDVLANADVETALAIREWGPAYNEAQTYRTPTIGESMGDQRVPDHGPLMHSVDTRLAELSGPDAVAALVASHNAVGVAAYIAPGAKHMDAVIAGINGGSTGMSAAIEAHYAEQEARAGLGLPEQTPAADTEGETAADAAPATEGGTV